MRSSGLLFIIGVFVSVTPGYATIFGTVRGVVHDPQHHPVQGAGVTIRALQEDWARSTRSSAEGEFEFTAVPVGRYTITVGLQGFQTAQERLTVHSGSAPVYHFALELSKLEQTVEVSAAPELVHPESSTTENIIDRRDIEKLPGAGRTNSLAMITDSVPGAYIVHDQLHIRGGHQVSWLVDGIPMPNTNIAENLGPLFDPKDVDYLEVQRGGYSAEYGDRTFGVFNLVPRSGFERDNAAELVAGIGSYRESNDQFSVGGHTTRFAYYGSLSGNRSDLGLQTPGTEVLHDQTGSLGGFASLIYNATPNDQLRLVSSARGDHYQVPNTSGQEALGFRDVQDERDAFMIFSWVHTMGPGKMITVSPLYHRNRTAYEGGPGDTPVSTRDDRISSYAGGEVFLSVVKGKHNLRAGFSALGQRDSHLFGLKSTDGSGLALEQSQNASAGIEEGFVEDQYRLTHWLTFNGGLRLTRFSGILKEDAASPRLGAALRLPVLNWVMRGFYGRYYQPPPLSTISGPLLQLAVNQGFGFLPLHGERDEQHEIGLAIPFRGWSADVTYYSTHARNFFDHDVLGNSNIFLPLTIAAARLRGWEATIQSARLFGRARMHLAYAHAYAEGKGAVSGGLTEFSPPEGGYFFLDHDQRNTLETGFETELPGKMWASTQLSYGSGFLNGDGPAHLPGHTTLDLSLGKSFGEKLSLQLDALNLTDRRYLLDNSNTFGGTHYNYPRQISLTLRYRFHY